MSWIQPKSLLFWVYCLIVCTGAFALLIQLLPVARVTWGGILVGLPFTVATFAMVTIILHRLDLLRAHRVIGKWLALGFVWGAGAGTGIAMFANDKNMRFIQNVAGDGFALNWQAPISASIVEEGIKGVGVFAVAWLSRPILQRPMHGLLLGGFTGLGFQVVENITYSANAGINSAQGAAGPALLVGILRLITGLTSHWMFTALAGIGIVVALAASDRSTGQRFSWFLGFYLLGAALHFAWDAPQPEDAGLWSIGLKMLVYITLFAIVYLRVVVRDERRWFRAASDWAVRAHLAPPGELDTLVTGRARRAARRAHPGPAGMTRRRQRELVDWVQVVGTRRDTETALAHHSGQGEFRMT